MRGGSNVYYVLTVLTFLTTWVLLRIYGGTHVVGRYLGIFLFILVREGWEGDLPLPCGVVYEVGMDFLEIDLDDLSVSFLLNGLARSERNLLRSVTWYGA